MDVGLAEQLEIEEDKTHVFHLRLGAKQLEFIQLLRPAERRVALVKAALAKQQPAEG